MTFSLIRHAAGLGLVLSTSVVVLGANPGGAAAAANPLMPAFN
jgi:hypothetical protein